MREILFRGKRVDNGNWVYGYYVFQRKRCGAFGQTLTEFDYDRHLICSRGKDYLEIVPETVGEFTGLTDKNGTKIFAGDIVRDCDGRIYEIKHFDFEWIAEQTRAFWINIKHLKPCEIIANIYDNYELLEENNDKN